jgi:hypothetical protein
MTALRQTKERLESFYAPFNEELAVLMNDTAFLWNSDP